MDESALGSWVAYAGFAALLVFIVDEWRQRGLLGPRPRPTSSDPRVLLLLAVGAWLISQLVVMLVIENVTTTETTRLLVAVGAHVVVALLVLRPALAGSPRPELSPGVQVTMGGLGGLATFALVFVTSLGVMALYGFVGIAPDEIPTQGVVETLAEASRGDRLLIVFTACAMAPFAEEVFYRGVLLPALATKMSVGLALLVQALVFGFIHFWAVPLMWPLALPLAVVGWCAGWLYVRTGSLLGAIVLHMVFNGVQVALLFASSGPPGIAPSGG